MYSCVRLEMLHACRKGDCLSAINNSTCINNTCVCDPGFYANEDNDTCILRKIGDTNCAVDLDCSAAVMWSNCTEGTCFCDSGFISINHDTVCRSRVITDNCTLDTDCKHSVSNSNCTNNICHCDSGLCCQPTWNNL